MKSSVFVLILMLLASTTSAATQTWYAHSNITWGAGSWYSAPSGGSPGSLNQNGDVYDSNGFQVTIDNPVNGGFYFSAGALQDSSSGHNGLFIGHSTLGSSSTPTNILATATVINSGGSEFTANNVNVYGTLKIGTSASTGYLAVAGTMNVLGGTLTCMQNNSFGSIYGKVISPYSGGTLNIQSGLVQSPSGQFGIVFGSQNGEPLFVSCTGGTLDSEGAGLYLVNPSLFSMNVSSGACVKIAGANFYSADPGAGNVLSPTSYAIFGASKTGSAISPSSSDVWTGVTYGVSGTGSTGTVSILANKVLVGTSIHGTGGTYDISQLATNKVLNGTAWGPSLINIGNLGATWTATSGTQGLSGIVFGGSGGTTYTGSATTGMTVTVGTATISGGTATALSLAGSQSQLTTSGGTLSGTLYSGTALISSQILTSAGTVNIGGTVVTPSYNVTQLSAPVVLNGTSWGNNNNNHGVYQPPLQNSYLNTAAPYGPASNTTGTLTLPPTVKVLSGTVFGVSGSGSTGTYLPRH